MVDKDGCWFILGRSDDTIKVAGKRLGPAEVEAIVNAHEGVVESAAVGVPHPVKGQEVGLFVVPGDHFQWPDAAADSLDATDYVEALRAELNTAVIAELGKPLKPAFVRFTRALPKTRNAKVMRRLIQAVHEGKALGDTSSLEHPSTLDAIREAI